MVMNEINNVWEFLDNQEVWFKATMIVGILFLGALIVRKDIKSKWFSMKKRDRRPPGPRKGTATVICPT